jgi:hypothetical protein
VSAGNRQTSVAAETCTRPKIAELYTEFAFRGGTGEHRRWRQSHKSPARAKRKWGFCGFTGSRRRSANRAVDKNSNGIGPGHPAA